MSEKPIPAANRPSRHPVRRTLLTALLIAAVAFVAVCWYATTPAFQSIVRKRLVTTLETATGGRVELGSFHWRLLHLEFEATDLTIHGLEAPGEIPYAHIDRLFVRAKIISFFQAKAGLRLLQGENPVFHLIVNADGTTNQPHPKTASKGGNVTDTLFNLAVDRAEVSRGLLLLNQRAIPFDVAANDLGIVVTYDSVRDHYLAQIRAADITTQRGKSVAVHSQLSLNADLSRTNAVLSRFRLQTGPTSDQGSLLEATGALNNYSDPQFDIALKGSIDLREVETLSAIPGLDRGVAELQLNGKGNLKSFVIDGQTTVTGAAYRIPQARFSGVTASTNVHITQDELALTALKGRLPEGGGIDGELHLVNWLAPTPAAPTKKDAVAKRVEKLPAVAQGTIHATVRGITLRDVMKIVAPLDFADLGFNTSASGPISVEWSGNSDDLTASANVALTPGTRGDGVPVSGSVDATYHNRQGAVDIRRVIAQTPGTHLQVQGSLGVYPLDRQSAIHADVTTTNLGEFDKTLAALGVSTTGPSGKKTGLQVLPVHLQGEAEFHGAVSGSLLLPDVKGRLTATNFETVFDAATAAPTVSSPPVVATPAVTSPTPPSVTATAVPEPGSTIHWDSLDAQAEYSPDLISVQQSTLLRGKTTVHASGQLHVHHISRRHSAFDLDSALNANLNVQNASIADLLTIAGSQAPVTGTLNMTAQVGGSLSNLNGGGHVAVQGGQVYGEAYRSLDTDLKFAGQELDATHLHFLQDGGQITGDGGYDLRAKTVHFQAQGNGFELAHIPQLQSGKFPVSGQLHFDANGSGSIHSPVVQANIHLAQLLVDRQFQGNLDAHAHLERNDLVYQISSTLASAHLQLNGETGMTGNLPTKAQLTITQLKLEPFLQVFNVQNVSSNSVLTLQASLTGPAREPTRLQGALDVDKFTGSIGGIALQAQTPLHAQLRDGVVHLDLLRITGDDTNLQAVGSVSVFDTPRTLDLHASGAINLKLAQSFDPNITSSGHADFFVDATGTMQRPTLGGQIKFTNAAMALGDLPNGLSQITGTLTFDQDRLTVQKLTAVTGGGRLDIAGAITYQQGLYGDLTATGKDIRIRYPQGVSSMADAKLRLQGTEKNLLLSGNILVTRFSISPNLDLASLKSSTSASATLPDANAMSNHVQLDVHITSAPELNFQNSFAKLAGDVDLRIRGTVAEPAILGHISVTDGSANFAGATYQLQRGEVYFSNPIHIDPVIDLDATTRVEDYDIDVGLHGTLSKLNLTYRSEPPLPEADIFALLALGRTQEEQQIYSQEQQAAGVNSTADALLGGALNATVSNRIQKLFGVGSVKIDPTFVGNLGNATARITVEEKIGKSATLTYATNVNSTAQQLIQGQIYITPNVSVVAQRDESGVFSMILKVHQRRR